MNRVAKQTGFTLIELLLAMAFISVLLLAVAMTVLQIGTIYNRGLTLKDINQTARSIMNEIGQTLTTSGSLSTELSARQYVAESWGGRLCVGSYSYIWNYGKALAEGSQDVAQYNDSTEPIIFVKVPDGGGNYCSGAPAYERITSAGGVELLSTSDHNLVLHSLSLTTTASASDQATGQQLYTLNLTIGTNDINALNDTQTGCKPPGIPGADLTYCSVQQFSVVLRTGNGAH